MLVMTREAKGWTQRELATRSGISQAVISKIETGAADVGDERLQHLADVLDCPPALLCRPAVRVDTANTCLHHRRRHSKLSAAATRRIEGIAHLTRVSVEGIFDGIHAQLETDVDVAAFSALESAGRQAASSSDGGDMDAGDGVGRFDPSRADAAARLLRRTWGLAGPIANLVATLETHGILVVFRNLGSRAQDGVSSWPADLTHPPIIVVNSDISPDRVRFTVAHELGHLLLHRLPSDDAEREANRFAAEFLVPANAIADDLAGLTTGDFARLARLKLYWGTSIGMLIQRALDTGSISDRQFREFRVRLTKLGWDVNEPGQVPEEVPTLLRRALELGRSELGLSDDDLAEFALMTPASFRRHYGAVDAQNEEPRTILNLAGNRVAHKQATIGSPFGETPDHPAAQVRRPRNKGKH